MPLFLSIYIYNMSGSLFRPYKDKDNIRLKYGGPTEGTAVNRTSLQTSCAGTSI